MTVKELWKNILFYTTVPKCVCCNEKLDIDDNALCKECIKDHRWRGEQLCASCAKPIRECLCAPIYLQTHYVKRLIKLFRYRSSFDSELKVPSNELIYHIKRSNRVDLVRFISNEMSEAIVKSIPDYKDFAITNIPRSKNRVMKYGHDHAAIIAKAVAENLGIEYVSVLRSLQKKAQKKLLRREERMTNAKYDYKRSARLDAKKIFVLDDIVTSGASMGHAAMLLKGLGAKAIVGVVMGIAYRDEHTEKGKYR